MINQLMKTEGYHGFNVYFDKYKESPEDNWKVLGRAVRREGTPITFVEESSTKAETFTKLKNKIDKI